MKAAIFELDVIQKNNAANQSIPLYYKIFLTISFLFELSLYFDLLFKKENKKQWMLFIESISVWSKPNPLFFFS